MHFARYILISTAALLALAAVDAFASGGGSMSGPSGGSMDRPQSRSPEQLALEAYNSGVRELGKAKDHEADAAKAGSDEKKAAKALDKARKSYGDALEQFERAVDKDPGLYQAWNYVGFCQRHLGDYESALTAYSHALELKPAYGEAVEYQAEAFLGLNRIEDVKTSYMRLFRDVRPLADELMTAIRHWVDDHERDSKGVSSEDLAGFAKWVDERAAVAQQTASLSPGDSTKPRGDWQ
jgi:tetratricopeptide (TPR) repeat protein